MPPAKGLRGVLDNIVSDGMRVATEVRKRVDEAQREMERNAVARPHTNSMDDDADDEEERSGEVEADRRSLRSVRERDRELLEGAEAEVEVGGKAAEEDDLLGEIDDMSAVAGPSVAQGEKVVEFER